jgi:hypothetical protein
MGIPIDTDRLRCLVALRVVEGEDFDDDVPAQ